jgi:hypothetical protein
VAERVLSARELNRAVLARQLLLERSPLPPVKAVERVAGLQTQYAPSGYVGLWSRLVGFRRADLTDALAARRLWVPPAGLDMARVAEAVRGYLAPGPLTQAELQRHLATDGFPRDTWRGVQLWVDLVRVPPAGTWEKPRAHVYGLADEWLRRATPVTEEAGRELLAARYLRGFGPASVKDVASFCGWTLTEVREVLARLELRRFRDEAGGELLDVPRAPLPPADTPAPVRFLGQWDATLLVHARRAQILPEAYRPRVFATSMPQSVPTFLVDGQVAGTWRHVDGRVRWEAFDALTARSRAAVDTEAERLGAEMYG